jgi:hypothetical protein
MAIDINEEVKVWGGFSPTDFWLGAAVLLFIAALAVFVGTRTSPMIGGILFFLAGGGFMGFMVHRKALPRGLLLRRFLQDGSFLFLKFPQVHGVDVYLPPASERAKRFAKAFEDSREAL